MYGKIFDSIYDGTLAEDWRALITFQQFIVLCDADGMVDMTPQSMSRRTGIPIEHIIAGIEVLEKNDKYSRTPDEDGKRIELIDSHRAWGWHIINHEKYKNIRDADTIRAQTRERVRRHREKKRSVTLGNDSKRHIDKETETETDTIKNTMSSPSGDNVPFQKILDLYHKHLPELPKCEILNTTRKGYIRQRWQDKNHGLFTLDHWENFFKHIKKSEFLMGKSQSNNGRPPFRANLEWVTKPNNYTKIYEDKYHGE